GDEVGVEVGKLLVGEVRLAVCRHVLARRAYLVLEAGPGERIGHELRPGATLAALPEHAMAGVALVLHVGFFSFSGGAARSVLCEGSAREKKNQQQSAHAICLA